MMACELGHLTGWDRCSFSLHFKNGARLTALTVIVTSYPGSRWSSSSAFSSSTAIPCRKDIAASTFPNVSIFRFDGGNTSSNKRRADKLVKLQYQVSPHSLS